MRRERSDSTNREWGRSNAGKGDFYLLRYGPYLFAMNTTPDRAITFDVPAEFSAARDLVRPAAAPGGPGPRSVGPRSTVILRLAD